MEAADRCRCAGVAREGDGALPSDGDPGETVPAGGQERREVFSSGWTAGDSGVRSGAAGAAAVHGGP